MKSSKHISYIKKAIELAKKGEGCVEQGPLVGSVLVRNGKIIARGYYGRNGLAHAEQQVLLPGKVRGDNAILYVTMEPCVDFKGKRTPSCAKAIINSGIKRVVIAMNDPNRKVNGKGVSLLRKNGIDVITGICKEDAEFLNRSYIKYIKEKVPYIIAKWAMSVDGKIATASGESKWITSARSREIARGIRKKCQGVILGIGTVLKDNPRIREARRIILDSGGRIPLDCNIVRTAHKIETFLVVTNKAKKRKLNLLTSRGVRILYVRHNSFTNVIKRLGSIGFSKVMVEGGGEVLGSAFEEGCVDEVYVFIGGKLIGGRNSRSPVEGKGVSSIKQALNLQDIEFTKIGTDIMLHAII